MTPTPVSQEALKAALSLMQETGTFGGGADGSTAQAFARFESTIRKQERDQCARLAEELARRCAEEVHLYDSYGGPSLPGRDREALREAVAKDIATAIRKGSEA